MMVIEKKYYSLSEALTALGKYGLTVDVIRGCTQEGLIHPVIYIDSLAAHACEQNGIGSAVAVGQCLLSCYVDLGDEITPAIDLLVRDKSFLIRTLVKKVDILGLPKMFSWEYDARLFVNVPPGHSNPKQYSDVLDIRYFILLSSNMRHVEMTEKNIAITNADFNFLKDRLGTRLTTGDNDQPLSRSAIKQNYTKIKPTAWEKIFQRESDNSLIDAKISHAAPYMYSRQKVESWLIANNYYQINELSQNEDKKKHRDPADFSDIYRLVQT